MHTYRLSLSPLLWRMMQDRTVCALCPHMSFELQFLEPAPGLASQLAWKNPAIAVTSMWHQNHTSHKALLHARPNANFRRRRVARRTGCNSSRLVSLSSEFRIQTHGVQQSITDQETTQTLDNSGAWKDNGSEETAGAQALPETTKVHKMYKWREPRILSHLRHRAILYSWSRWYTTESFIDFYSCCG